eukprot:SM000014S00420  [mRNA]  locus=s14:1197090:1200017:- [translate_table: standard]
MWRRAREREEEKRREREAEEQRRPNEQARRRDAAAAADDQGAMLRREQQFASILQVPAEERAKVERQQILDRAAAALAAAESVLADAASDRARRQASLGRPTSERPPEWLSGSRLSIRRAYLSEGEDVSDGTPGSGATVSFSAPVRPQRGISSSPSGSPTLGGDATPGPDFWTWSPPAASEAASTKPELQKQAATLPQPTLLLKERDATPLPLPFETEVAGEKTKDLAFLLQSRAMPSLPPMQSLLEVEEKAEVDEEQSKTRDQALRVPELAEASIMMAAAEQSAKTEGVHPDGSRWWKEVGVDERENGEICHWTVVRGVSADGGVEWEEKWWETSDAFDYKELGAEKSGRDASGGVWRETWREAMWQDAQNGLPHLEKSADKWARNGTGGEWHEKWYEHYDALGRASKWADKWSKIDIDTPLEAGHGHVWHEKWGEEFDGKGAAKKYTDKWAERKEPGGGWTKWGDKWDEDFNKSAHGVKKGETWWEGVSGERWNRTWGEDHNGSGWVHKYGQSSSGEWWDTSEPMGTWYERRPHFGFRECLNNSRRLQQVGRTQQLKERRKKRTL